MRIALMTCAVALALAFPHEAAAQMRPGQPQVLKPAPRHTPPESTPWAALRERLGARNRVMLFWESQLEDELATGYREVETLDRRVQGNAAQVAGVASTYDGAVGVSVAGAEASLHQRGEKFTEGQGPARTALSADARAMQSEFMAQLRQGGVRFIDRTLATRLTGMDVEGERPNVHAIETQALVGHADYLVEVTSRIDASTTSGRRFHVALRDVTSGETLVDFDTSAEPGEAAPQPWVAGANGFERATPKAATSTDTARVLADETGRHLADALVHR